MKNGILSGKSYQFKSSLKREREKTNSATVVPPSIIHLFLSQQRWMNDESIFFFSLGRVQLRQHFYQDLFLQVFVVGLSGEIRWSARSSPRHQHLQNQTQRHLRRKLSSWNVAKKKTFSFTSGLENHDNKNKRERFF